MWLFAGNCPSFGLAARRADNGPEHPMSRPRQRTNPTVSPTATGRRRTSVAFAAVSICLFAAGAIVGVASPAGAATATVGLRTAAPFAILAGSTVTNTGPSVISGDLGLSPGGSVTGFPPGVVINGSQHVADAVSIKAKTDLTTAYNNAAGRPTASDVTGKDLGGMTLTPGVYEASTSMALTGALTLNAQGDPAAVFIFKAGSTLVAATNSTVRFSNGGSACNVFWQVGSSATLHPSSEFVGTIMAQASATIETGTTIEGRVLARTGAVTLDTNVITAPRCAAPLATGTATATATASATGTPTGPNGGGSTAGPRGGGTSTTTPSPTTPMGSPTLPVIPKNHPKTGLGGSPHASTSATGTALYLLAGLASVAALVTAGLGFSSSDKRRRG